MLVLRVRHVCPSERFGPCPTQSAIPTGFAVGVGLELHKIWNFASPGPHHGARRSANSCHACYKAGPLLLLQPCQFAPKRQCLSQNVNGCVSECVAILLYYFNFFINLLYCHIALHLHTHTYTHCVYAYTTYIHAYIYKHVRIHIHMCVHTLHAYITSSRLPLSWCCWATAGGSNTNTSIDDESLQRRWTIDGCNVTTTNLNDMTQHQQ